MSDNQNDEEDSKVPLGAGLGVLDFQPTSAKKKTKESKVFISRGWIIFLCVLVILLIIVIALLATYLPKCRKGPISSTIPVYATPAMGEMPNKPKNIWDIPRLPDHIEPIHYFMDIAIDLDEFTFSGNTTIRITCRRSKTRVILLHAKDLTIHAERVSLKSADDIDSKAPDVIDVKFYKEHQFVLVELRESLRENMDYLLRLEFEANLREDLVGLYKSSYTTPQGETRWLATTFLSPTHARKAFPCFDEPGLKANFTISITHRQEYTALSNMDQIGPQEPGPSEGWITTRFGTTPKMSTYIICYTVMDFSYKETYTKRGVRVRTWSREEIIDNIDYGLQLTANLLQYYEEYLDYPYTLSKMDVVAVPDFLPRAMENWGLMTYRESKLLYVPGVVSAAVEEEIVTIMAHEIAHQYFGNLVTHAWWDYMMLKEGLATFTMFMIGAPYLHPDWNMETQVLTKALHPSLAYDCFASSRPVQVKANTANEVNQLFDVIAYNKGASILRMCQSFLGEETFQKGLQIYIKNNAFSTATNDQFWAAHQQAADEDGVDIDVATIMHTWVLQMGYPVVNITRDYTNNDVINFRADQKRFLQDPKATVDTHYEDLGYVWWVPLTFSSKSTSGSNNQIVWMEKGPAAASIDGSTSDWLLVNLGQTGFYRVNYDTRNWKLLSQQLVTDYLMIPEGNRAALLNDAFNLARAGELNQAIALDITLYLDNETAYVPWKTVTTALGYLNTMLSRTAAYGTFKKYFSQKVATVYNKYGWQNEGDHMEKITRGVAIGMACQYGFPHCVEEALGLYRLWISDPDDNSIAADYRLTVYCAAIGSGGQDEWKFAFAQYQNTSIAAEKSTLLKAMACADKPWILSTYLSYVLDLSKIRAQDRAEVISLIAGNPVGSPLAWDFFRANWDFLRKEHGDSIFNFGWMIEGVTDYFNTNFHLQQLLDFMKTHPDQGTGETAFKQSVEKTQANIRWMEANYKDVKYWLDQVLQN